MDGTDSLDVGFLGLMGVIALGAVGTLYSVFKKPAEIRGLSGLSGVACGKLKRRYTHATGKRRTSLRARARRAGCAWVLA